VIQSDPVSIVRSDSTQSDNAQNKFPLSVECLCSDLYCFTITGYAFLWHQVRCMVAVMFMIGRGEEEPDVISHLLDIQKLSQKPSYEMASELPLVLFHCEFPTIRWIVDEVANYKAVMGTLWHSTHMEKLIQSVVGWGMVQGMALSFPELNVISNGSQSGDKHQNLLVSYDVCGMHKPVPLVKDLRHKKKQRHIPLLQRAREPSVNERVDLMSERKRKRYDDKFSKKKQNKSEEK
jgi:hypothetical protein